MAEHVANTLNIRVHKFETRPEPVRGPNGKPIPGKFEMVDFVTYGPPMMQDRLAVEARVDRVLKAQPPTSPNNIAERTAWERAEYIRPSYEKWKRGEKLPETGTPIAVLNFLRPEEAQVLKMAGVLTVEDLAGLLDTNMQQVKLPAMREKRAQAKKFLEAADANKALVKMAEQDAEIEALKAQMADLIKAQTPSAPDKPADDIEVDENGDRIPKRRGRPPKVDTQEQSEAA